MKCSLPLMLPTATISLKLCSTLVTQDYPILVDTSSFKDMLQIFSSKQRVKDDQKLDSRRRMTVHRHRLPHAMCCYVYSRSIHSTKEPGDHVAKTSTHFKHPNKR